MDACLSDICLSDICLSDTCLFGHLLVRHLFVWTRVCLTFVSLRLALVRLQLILRFSRVLPESRFRYNQCSFVISYNLVLDSYICCDGYPQCLANAFTLFKGYDINE